MATPIKENTTALEDLLDRARALPSVPGSVEQATPTISVSSGGLITASATQAAGVVAAGTKSATKQLPTKGATTIEPSDEVQTAVPAGTYVTGDIKVAAQSGSTQIQMKEGQFTVQAQNDPNYPNFGEVSLDFQPDVFVVVFTTYYYTEDGQDNCDVSSAVAYRPALFAGKINTLSFLFTVIDEIPHSVTTVISTTNSGYLIRISATNQMTGAAVNLAGRTLKYIAIKYT